MDCSLPGSSVHGIFQARMLEWVAISFSRRSSPPRDWIQVSCIVGRRFTVWATREDWLYSLYYKPDYQESLQWPPVRVKTQILSPPKPTLSLMLFFMNCCLAKLISTSCPYFLPHTHSKFYYKLILSDFTNILSVIYYFYLLNTLLFSHNFQPQKI